MKILITGGTVFVSKYAAEYFTVRGNEVFVLNRNSRPQVNGVRLINCDRHNLGNTLKHYEFDAVLDITAYNSYDIKCLLDSLGEFNNYILISSSSVYPETSSQPFSESSLCGKNIYWGDYGLNKIAAEKCLLERVPSAYIIRPPYLYGAMNNLYREAFVFDCAEMNRKFYIPKDGKMPLQFFNIEDLCRFIEVLLEKCPTYNIFNVGNPDIVDTLEWVNLCYKVLGKTPEVEFVNDGIPQRNYFPFADYGYILDVSEQKKLMSHTKPLADGLCESYEWYRNNRDNVRVKPLIEFIDAHFD